MRGIAALVVLVAHCLMSFPNGRIEASSYELMPDNALLSILQVTVHGNSAVIFFYVLSGLVLGESFRRSAQGQRSERVLSFLVKRLFRLYPAMILSVLLASAMLVAVKGVVVPGMYPPMNAPMLVTVDFVTILKNLLAIETGLNPLLWSVQVEIVMIVILPMLVATSNRSNLFGDCLVLAVLIIIGVMFWNRLPNPLRFVYCFQLGLMLPSLLKSVRLQSLFRSSWVALAGLLAMVFLDWLYVRGSLWLPYKFVTDTFISAQWIGFVLVRELPAVRWLAARPLVFLGDISYSLYVYSMTVQLAITGLVLPQLMAGSPTNSEATALELLLIVGTAAVAVPLATLTYFLVERPFVAIGRRFSASSPRSASEAALNVTN